MDQAVNVAVVRSAHRREAAAQALALVVDDLRARVTPVAVILPQITPADYTHAETLSATIDALLHAGADELVVQAASRVCEQLGYRRETFGRPVRFTDPVGMAGEASTPSIAATSCVVGLVSPPRSLWKRGLRATAGFLGTPSETSPHILIVDAFDVRRVVIAGTDAGAVVAVANAELGGDRAEDLSRIRLLGDVTTPGRGMRRGRLHSGPHLATAPKRDRVA